MIRFFYLSLIMIMGLFLVSCVGSTSHIAPVKNFELEKYMGIWYEIIRLPHSFENGLTDVSATYKIKDDGEISVLNKGYRKDSDKWTSVEGYAYFKGDKKTGELEVVFFWPFAGDYKVIYLDNEYKYAVVTGSTMSYFWLLSRTPDVDQVTIDKFISMAKSWGFETDKFIYPQILAR